ncbi:PH domain-containing protein [Mammaliicoccus stepanovicii]|uniref:PH domain-containing protein n=1 Tax=Mammaliicoccus stepanovicii TaxID=643214 RepID=UPI0019866EE2|nr:PH domain-containing protein [Mammaliicoccus stepanovicii]GGI41301.1 hypothetical protein GCM10010896_12680 [Mammaliicoccus stepanovicii]
MIYIVSLIVLFIGVTGFITPFIRLKRTSFEIGHRHLEIQSGLYFQKRYVQPYNRIQYVTIKHGPISRRLNIYFLVVVTAGNQRFLPMMGRDMAEEARLKIMTNVKEVLDDV